jgi:hypothetical protein
MVMGEKGNVPSAAPAQRGPAMMRPPTAADAQRAGAPLGHDVDTPQRPNPLGMLATPGEDDEVRPPG